MVPSTIRTLFGAALGALFMSVGTADAQSDSTAKPTVLVIATGGTIAGVQDAPGTLGRYRAGTLSAEQVVASVPELSRYAKVEAEQFSNVASTQITPAHWVALSRRINAVFRERPDVAGIVVTHGTDRLEETAFFLYLTVRSERPVVVVGAQRPATGISPDGPINLLAAVRTAASEKATSKGVLVVMDDRILSAREVRKQYQRVGGFGVGEMGMLGVVGGDGPDFLFAPVRRHGPESEFDLEGVDSLPRVELTFSYPGGTGPQYDPLPDGLVVATTGFAPDEGPAFRRLRDAGVVVVTAFPSGDNMSTAGTATAGRGTATAGGGTATAGGGTATAGGGTATAGRGTATAGSGTATAGGGTATAGRGARAITSQHLTPQKARILLMLALTKTRDLDAVQRFFITY